MNKCINCNEETKNPKFCSRKCSAIYNNKKFPKVKLKEVKCIKCGKILERVSYKNYSIICKECKDNSIFNDTATLESVIYTQHHKSSAFALIRTRARAIAKKLGLNTCFQCGYDKHVEVCHKKPISSFSKETLILEINSVDNLIILCPNCHWEYDHEIT